MAKIDVSSATGEFNTASLARALDKREVNELAVDAWFENARGTSFARLVWAHCSRAMPLARRLW